MSNLLRIIVLASGFIAASMLFYAVGFAGFAPAWQWQQNAQSQRPGIALKEQRLSSWQQGVLLTGVSDAIDSKLIGKDRRTSLYRYQRTLQIDLLADNAPLLLNLQISADKSAIRQAVASRTGIGTDRDIYPARALVPVTQIVIQQGDNLHISARFLGTVEQQQCSAQGHCLIVFYRTPYSDSSVFYSADGGENWRWLPQWQQPEAYVSYQILGISGSQSVLIVQQGKLYRSEDLGQHWQLAMELAPLLLSKGIDPSLYTPNWRFDGADNVIVWNAFNDMEDETLAHFLLTDFNLQTQRVQSNQWIEGAIGAGEYSTQGDFYFILANQRRGRYSLNRLQSDGRVQPVLETGKKRLAGLYVGKDLLMMSKQDHDAQHMTVSTDGGQRWFRMEKLTQRYDYRVWFDRWHNRLFRFPAIDSQLGNDAGLVYETVTVSPPVAK